MGWNTDFEISDVKIVRDFSFKAIEKSFNEDIRKIGLRKAIENVVENFDILEQVNEAVETPYFLDECDNAFAMLVNSLAVIQDESKCTISLYPIVAEMKSDYGSAEWDVSYCEDRVIFKLNNDLKSKIESNIEEIEKREELLNANSSSIDKSTIKFEIGYHKETVEIGRMLLCLQGDKSIYEIFVRNLEAMTALYCKKTGKELKGIRKAVYDKAAKWTVMMSIPSMRGTLSYRELLQPYTRFSAGLYKKSIDD